MDTTLKKSGDYVDSSKKAVSSQVNSKMNLHTDNLKWFDEARGKFSSRLVGSVEYVKKEGFQGTAQTAVGLVANALEDAKQLPSYLNKETKVRQGDAYVRNSSRLFWNMCAVSGDCTPGSEVWCLL